MLKVVAPEQTRSCGPFTEATSLVTPGSGPRAPVECMKLQSWSRIKKIRSKNQ